MSRRASLPGADELFRRTSSERMQQPRTQPARTQQPRSEPSKGPQSSKSTNLQVADTQGSVDEVQRKAPKHQEKVTFYCTSGDLMALESARLRLRSEHGIAADRGRIVRAALAYVLEDFEARGDDAVLLRKIGE